MTWRDKLELGLKDDAAYRKDNLTPNEIRGPEVPSGPGRSPAIPMARGDRTEMHPDTAEADTPEVPGRKSALHDSNPE